MTEVVGTASFAQEATDAMAGFHNQVVSDCLHMIIEGSVAVGGSDRRLPIMIAESLVFGVINVIGVHQTAEKQIELLREMTKNIRRRLIEDEAKRRPKNIARKSGRTARRLAKREKGSGVDD